MFRQAPVANNPAPAQYYVNNCLYPDMINVGWVKVSSNITVNTANTTNAWAWDVLKSPAANNQIGKDWYLAFGVDIASNANLALTIFELWNIAGSNQATGYPPGMVISATGTASLPPQAPNAWCNVNSSVLPYAPASNCGVIIAGVNATNTNAFSTFLYTYSHSVTIDRVITMSSNAATVNSGHAFYAGTYDSFMNPLQDVMPICAINWTTVVNSYQPSNAPGQSGVFANNVVGMATREPELIATGNTYNWVITSCGGLNFPPVWSSSTPHTDYYANKYTFSRGMISGMGGGLRGLLKDVYVTNAVNNRGDTSPITINGVTYTTVFVGSNQNNGYFMNGAGSGVPVCAPTFLAI